MSGRRRQSGEDAVVVIKLSAGASVSLTFRGNLFDLTREERELIGNLSAVIQIFRDATDRPETPAVVTPGMSSAA
jgi:hypothetical protein